MPGLDGDDLIGGRDDVGRLRLRGRRNRHRGGGACELALPMHEILPFWRAVLFSIRAPAHATPLWWC